MYNVHVFRHLTLFPPIIQLRASPSGSASNSSCPPRSKTVPSGAAQLGPTLRSYSLQQGPLAQAAGISPHKKASSFLSASSPTAYQFQPRKSSSMCSPSSVLTDVCGLYSSYGGGGVANVELVCVMFAFV